MFHNFRYFYVENIAGYILGEDGTIQSQLTEAGVPYSGSGVMACAIGMDKYAQKRLMSAAGFVMPEMIAINRFEWIAEPSNILGNHKETTTCCEGYMKITETTAEQKAQFSFGRLKFTTQSHY